MLLYKDNSLSCIGSPVVVVAVIDAVVFGVSVDA